MREFDRIRKMTIDEMTTSLVKILTCKRCFCYEACQRLKATKGAGDMAPCTVAIRQFLESEVTSDETAKIPHKKTANKSGK
jgi:hypothetical protein